MEDLYLRKLTEYFDKEQIKHKSFSYIKKDNINNEDRALKIDF